MRAVNIETGNEASLQGVFGTGSWAPGSARLAVASRQEGLSVEDVTAGTRLIIQPPPCAWVDWSPTGERLAANCHGHLIIVDAAGNLLTSYDDLDPGMHAWSADGRLLAAGSWNAAIMVIDGRTQSPVDGSFRWFRWLSDGRLAVVTQPDDKAPATVRILDPQNHNAVVAEIQTQAAATSTSVNAEGSYAAYAVPAADWVATPFTATTHLISMKTGREVATFDASPQGYPNAPLEFSPDGGRVLVQTDVCRTWGLATGGVDGALTTIVPSGGFGVVKFSPDGKLIAFTRATELWVVPADGGESPRRLATGVHGPAGFAWSPDSRWIAFLPFFGGFGACE